ncbi:hypothetical protein [Streptomyces sp. NPDC002566]|uniref:hypothetical protein n=1 Tax=Streptomyces sp. NPDC002566 TaxID=3364650 RepID=UPI0036AFE255
MDLFAEDGVFNNVVAGESYRGEHLGDLVAFMGGLAPAQLGVQPDFAAAVTASATVPG